jgi:DNA invertase Pin-like site-specific DNA recombinase
LGTDGEDTVMGQPGLAEALDQARKLKAPIIAAELDRLTRDISLLPELIAKGVSFFVAGLGGGDDALVLHSYVALSQKERCRDRRERA